MTNSIIKKTVTKAESSPYQSYPQFGDSVYIIDESDCRLTDIRKWCDAKIGGPYRSFHMGEEGIGFWFAVDSELFEKEWM